MTSRDRRTLLTMHASDRAVNQARSRAHQPRDLAAAGGIARAGRTRAVRWAGGGTDGNERLTSITGLVLIVLLLVMFLAWLLGMLGQAAEDDAGGALGAAASDARSTLGDLYAEGKVPTEAQLRDYAAREG
jgi:hypothetical protein